MRGLEIAVWVLALGAGGTAAAAAPCLRYEPEVVQLVGTTTRRTFPGPPNYQSVKQGDAPETYWILKLARPVCVEARREDETEVAEAGVRSLQIVIRDYARVRSLLGRRVRVTGTLFHAVTGHHNTRVLIDASSMVRDP